MRPILDALFHEQPASPSWADIVQAYSGALSCLIAILGFGVLIWQMFQLRRQMQGDTNDKMFAHYARIQTALNERESVHLRDYFLGETTAGDVPADSKDKDKVKLFAEMFVDFFEHLALQRLTLPVEARDCWERTAAWRFAHSSEVQLYYSKNKHLYTDLIASMLIRGADKLEGSVPKCPTGPFDTIRDSMRGKKAIRRLFNFWRAV